MDLGVGLNSRARASGRRDGEQSCALGQSHNNVQHREANTPLGAPASSKGVVGAEGSWEGNLAVHRVYARMPAALRAAGTKSRPLMRLLHVLHSRTPYPQIRWNACYALSAFISAPTRLLPRLQPRSLQHMLRHTARPPTAIVRAREDDVLAPDEELRWVAQHTDYMVPWRVEEAFGALAHLSVTPPPLLHPNAVRRSEHATLPRWFSLHTALGSPWDGGGNGEWVRVVGRGSLDSIEGNHGVGDGACSHHLFPARPSSCIPSRLSCQPPGSKAARTSKFASTRQPPWLRHPRASAMGARLSPSCGHSWFACRRQVSGGEQVCGFSSFLECVWRREAATITSPTQLVSCVRIVGSLRGSSYVYLTLVHVTPKVRVACLFESSSPIPCPLQLLRHLALFALARCCIVCVQFSLDHIEAIPDFKVGPRATGMTESRVKPPSWPHTSWC